MILRKTHRDAVLRLLRRYPVTAVLGARQVGKTTLARQVAARFKGPVHWFDLEDAHQVGLLGDARGVLGGLKGLVVLDEIQRSPEIYKTLRVLADRPGSPARFLILGSASPDLLRQSSESLAGRVTYHELSGLSLGEVKVVRMEKLWLRGGFPAAFLASSDGDAWRWCRDFTSTYLERDVSQWGFQVPAATLRRFWTMLAHYHGQIWNSSEFARSFGVADTTVRRYLDILEDTFMVRLLPAWHANLGKRQVKSPKVYFRDTGILHYLLGIRDRKGLETHPRVGASWEGFAVDQVLDQLKSFPEECAFWATHTGAELDLLVVRGRRRLGFEFKFTHTPTLTPSMRIALKDLGLESLKVVHAGAELYPMGDHIEAVPLSRIRDCIKPLS